MTPAAAAQPPAALAPASLGLRPRRGARSPDVHRGSASGRPAGPATRSADRPALAVLTEAPGACPRRRSPASVCGVRMRRCCWGRGRPSPGPRSAEELDAISRWRTLPGDPSLIRLTRTRPPPQHFGPGRSPGRGGEGSRSRPCLQRRRPSHQPDLGRPAEAHGRVLRDCATAAKLTTLRRGSPPGSSLGR